MLLLQGKATSNAVLKFKTNLYVNFGNKFIHNDTECNGSMVVHNVAKCSVSKFATDILRDEENNHLVVSDEIFHLPFPESEFEFLCNSCGLDKLLRKGVVCSICGIFAELRGVTYKNVHKITESMFVLLVSVTFIKLNNSIKNVKKIYCYCSGNHSSNTDYFFCEQPKG